MSSLKNERKSPKTMIEPVNTIEYNEPITLSVDSDCGGMRLDKLLSEALSGYSRSFVQSLFENGLVTCNGKAVQKSFKPKCGDTVEFTFPSRVKYLLNPKTSLLTSSMKMMICLSLISRGEWLFIPLREIMKARLSMRFYIIARASFRGLTVLFAPGLFTELIRIQAACCSLPK